MRQDECIRKLGEELQVKDLKFVNSSLPSVSIYMYIPPKD